MDLPVKFPSETEVILEDVARFRALSPRERIRSILETIAAETDRIDRQMPRRFGRVSTRKNDWDAG